MIILSPRLASFKYISQNSKEKTIKLEFSFDEDENYLENLSIYVGQLRAAIADVETEVERISAMPGANPKFNIINPI